MSKLMNFVRYGLLVSDEMLDLPNRRPVKRNAHPEDEIFVPEKEPVSLEKGDVTAMILAAFQVFGPFILVMIVIAAIILYFI